MDERLEITGQVVALHRRRSDGSWVLDRRVALADFLRELTAALPGRLRDQTLLLPPGTRVVRTAGHNTAFVVETAPQLRRLRWGTGRMGDDGPYREVRLAFPYVLCLLLFFREEFEELRLYYRTGPLEALTDPLLCSNLLNVQGGADLMASCRACLRGRPEGLSAYPIAEQVVRLLEFFWEAGFNADVKDDAFTRSRSLDPRIGSVEAWEAATAADPLFVLKLPWTPTGCVLGEAIDRLIALRPHQAVRLGDAAALGNILYRIPPLPPEG
ncbi:MAG: hypothetical protein ACREKF_14945 [Candidatus Methylomirabilales bacterium]